MMNQKEKALFNQAKADLNKDHAPQNDQAQKAISDLFSQDLEKVEI